MVFIPEKGAVNENIDSVCQCAIKDDIEILRRGSFLAQVCRHGKLLASMGSQDKTSISGTSMEILKKWHIVESALCDFLREMQCPGPHMTKDPMDTDRG
jgi:UDP-N-acetylmuramate-alanine ligase